VGSSSLGIHLAGEWRTYGWYVSEIRERSSMSLFPSETSAVYVSVVGRLEVGGRSPGEDGSGQVSE
jgi:hypothetical protein